jgi:Domain of unknown function (DUF4157)
VLHAFTINCTGAKNLTKSGPTRMPRASAPGRRLRLTMPKLLAPVSNGAAPGMRRLSYPTTLRPSQTGGLLQRKCACGGTPGPTGECAECRDKRKSALQRKAIARSEPAPAPPVVHAVLRSPGQPLDVATRAFMEARFGQDFGDVRIHTDARAAESARSQPALAYTVGREIVFGAGRYQPHTGEGKRLLAHELTHTLQQRAEARDRGAGPLLTDFQAERAAEAAAYRVAAGDGRGNDVLGSVSPRLQRASIEDCSAEHQKEVEAALDSARSALLRVATDILSSNPPTDVSAAFSTFFGTSGYNTPAAIALRLLIIRKGLEDVTIECENPGSFLYSFFCPQGTLAYTRLIAQITGLGSIHVCQPQFHDLTVAQRIGTLVHEGAHRFIYAPGDT